MSPSDPALVLRQAQHEALVLSLSKDAHAIADPRQANALASMLDGRARYHKRQSERHRRLARDARRRLAALEFECAGLGIRLTLQSDRKGDPHARNQASS